MDAAITGLTAYLERIARYLTQEHGLKIRRDNGDERVWLARHFGRLEGGRRRGRKEVVEYRLCHVKAFDFLDFQVRHLERRYRAGRPLQESLKSIALHITANGCGSIRRIYNHGQAGEDVTGVRTLSLKNYYTIGDDELAKLLIVNDERFAWIRELPVTYYPVANKALRAIESLDAFLGHFAGPGALIPRRIQQALDLQEKIALFQLVPGNHMNDIAATLKRHDVEFCDQPSANHILLRYYRDVMPEEKIRAATVYSYTGACRQIGQKVNMRIRSARRLAEERIAVLRKRNFARLPDIRTHAALVLERTDFNGVRLELIDTKLRLWQEARQMESCVDTYSQDINDGKCAIYHVVHEGADYTLEIGRSDDGALCAMQLQGVRNAEPPDSLQKKISAIFRNLRRSRIKGRHKTRNIKPAEREGGNNRNNGNPQAVEPHQHQEGNP